MELQNANIGWLYNKYYYHDINFKNGNTKKEKQEIEEANKKKFEKANSNLLKSKLPSFNSKQEIEDFVNQFIPYLSATENSSIQLKTTYPGLLLGSGYAHGTGKQGELKVGFYFDHTTGLPIIPGSSIKGVLRQAFKKRDYITKILQTLLKIELKDDWVIKKLEDKIFGGDDDKADGPGHFTKRNLFFDAIPIKQENTLLGDDYITPHKHPLKSPTPISFLKVMPGVSYQFNFQLKQVELAENSETLATLSANDLKKLFTQIILDFGLGAKTNTGYGQFNTTEKTFGSNGIEEFKTTKHIKQITPIIHFHANKALYPKLALVRGSDIKPRLEKFIIEQETKAFNEYKKQKESYNDDPFKVVEIPTYEKVYLKKKEEFFNTNKSYFVQYNEKDENSFKFEETCALDFSIKVKTNDYDVWAIVSGMISKKRGKIIEYKQNIYQALKRKKAQIEDRIIFNSPFFANNAFVNNPEKFPFKPAAFTDKVIEIEIFTTNKKVLALIKEHWDAFWCVHNFGMRSSKGFGSFLPYNKRNNRLSITNQQFQKHANQYGKVQGGYYNHHYKENYRDDKPVRGGIEEIFEHITEFYQKLKSGTSYGEKNDSYLMKYFKVRNKIWEKDALVSEIVSKDGNISKNSKIMYIRALLGLAEYIEINNTRIKISDKLAKDNDPDIKLKAIDRFASPIQFKITPWGIYLFTYEIPLLLHKVNHNKIGDRKFAFTIGENDKSILNDLKIPDNFKVSSFLNSPFINENGNKEEYSIAESFGFTKLN